MAKPYYHNGNRQRVEEMRKAGVSRREIAEKLGIAIATVGRHINQINHRKRKEAQHEHNHAGL